MAFAALLAGARRLRSGARIMRRRRSPCPTHYKTAPPAGASAALGGNWWRDFRSAELDRLEARIEPDNPRLRGGAGALPARQGGAGSRPIRLLSDGPRPRRRSATTSSPAPAAALGQPAHLLRRQSVARPVHLGSSISGAGCATRSPPPRPARRPTTICSRRRGCRCMPDSRAPISPCAAPMPRPALLARTIGVYRSALKLTQERLKRQYRAAHRRRARQGAARQRPGRRRRYRAGPRRAGKRHGGAVGQTASFFRIAAAAKQPATPHPPRAAPADLAAAPARCRRRRAAVVRRQ